LQRLLQSLDVKPCDCFIEIGPGLGVLTERLLPLVAQLVAIELDPALSTQLTERLSTYKQFFLYTADALTFDFSKLTPRMSASFRIVGNLPYNIGTPLLFYLLNFTNKIADLHFMLQKEVVDRLIASAGSPQYGRLSVMIQYYYQAKRLLLVPPGAFWPVPKVNSAVVCLKPWRPLPVIAKDVNWFSQLVKQAFSQRRKTLKNSLKGWIQAEQLMACGIDPQSRPEQLSVRDYVNLANSKNIN
jgi:16S rRNA (adenine1518-N6/adenine1519-N6)-dimethyltransferase